MKIKIPKRIVASLVAMLTIVSILQPEGSTGVFFSRAYAASTTVTYNGGVTYAQSTCGSFSVGGKRAYCIEHNKSTPGTGTTVTSSTCSDATILKMLYYGPDGPKPWSGFSGKGSNYEIVVMSKALSYVYAGTKLGDIAEDFYDYVMSAESPCTSSAFTVKQGTTDTNGKTYTATVGGSTQTTATFTYTAASSANVTTFTVPTSLTAYVTHGGTKTSYAAGKSVSLYSGDTFYFTAGAGVSATRTVNFTGSKAISATYYTPTNSSLQTLIVGSSTSVKTSTMNLEFEDVKGSMTLTKKSTDGTNLSGAYYQVYYLASGYPDVTLIRDADTTNGKYTNTVTASSGTFIASFTTTNGVGSPTRSQAGIDLGITISGNTLTNLPTGYYCIVERTAPTGYQTSTTIHRGVVNASTTSIVINATDKALTNNTLSLQKVSDNEEMTDENPAYSMEGAEYSVYAFRGSPSSTAYRSFNTTFNTPNGIDSYITDAGNIDTATLVKDTGLVYVGRFTVDADGVGRVTDISSSATWLSSSYSAWNKNSSATEITKLPDNVSNQDPTQTILHHYVTVETKLPTSGAYGWDATAHVLSSNGGEITSTEPTLNDPISITVNKTDDEGNIISPDEVGISLEGTVFKVSYYDGYYNSKSELSGVTAERTWYIETIQNFISGDYEARLDNDYLANAYTSDEFYLDELGQPTLPLGTVTIEEVKSAEGYVKDSGAVTDDSGTVYSDRIFIGQVRPSDTDLGASLFGINGSTENVAYTNELNLNISNSIERGNVSFSKLRYDTNTGMANVEFDISLLGTDENGEEVIIETHRVKTDANGKYNSAGDSSLWFYGTADESLWDESNIDASEGKLIYGTYLITEVKCQANKGFQPAEAVRVTVTDDNQTVDAGTFVNIPNPSIKTMERDKDTGTHLSSVSDSVTIIDTVSYSYLVGNANYSVKGILMELKDDGSVTPLLDDNGDYILAHTTFTSNAVAEGKPYNTSSGTVDVTYTFPAETLEGRIFVVYEYLFIEATEVDVATVTDLVVTNGRVDTTDVMVDNDGKLVCHADPTDANQTGYFPSITTTLKNDCGEYKGSATPFTDTVHLEGLIAGETYTVESKMYNATKGRFVSEDVLGTVTFKATSQKMDVDVSFTVDTRKLAGDKLVAYEYLYDSNGNLIISETDPNNTAQTDVVKNLPVLPSAGGYSSLTMVFISAMLIVTGVAAVMKNKFRNKKEKI